MYAETYNIWKTEFTLSYGRSKILMLELKTTQLHE